MCDWEIEEPGGFPIEEGKRTENHGDLRFHLPVAVSYLMVVIEMMSVANARLVIDK